jgi:DNA-binding response OmpR family regulator
MNVEQLCGRAQGACSKGWAVRILVVEDEPIIACDLADQLEAAGHVVIGPALTARSALDLFRTERPEAAVLDVNLGDETSVSVAEALQSAAIPFLVLSANARKHQPSIFHGAPWLSKPHQNEALRDTVAALAAMATASALIAAEA